MRYDLDMGFRPHPRRGPGPLRRRPFYDEDFAFEGGYAADFRAGPRYDEEYGYDLEFGGRGRPGYEDDFEARPHGWALGYGGGALRSRGSWQAGQLRSGYNDRDEFEFEWGDGYVGGRGYGGTNYDLNHGYSTSSRRRAARPSGAPVQGGQAGQSSPATRGGYEWGEEHDLMQASGAARYGLGPYHHRLQLRRRPDEEIKADVEETLFYDTWVDAESIEVVVEEGVVTLRGDLPDPQEIRFATDDAWDVEGVRGVRSELRVSGREGIRGDARAGRERDDQRAVAREGESADREKAQQAAAPRSAGGSRPSGKAASKRGKSRGDKR